MNHPVDICSSIKKAQPPSERELAHSIEGAKLKPLPKIHNPIFVRIFAKFADQELCARVYSLLVGE